MNYKQKLMRYCKGVSEGKIVSCVWVKRAVARFLSELEKSEDANFPFLFSMSDANVLLSFCESLKIADLNGERLELLDWQIFVLANLEGWRWKSDKGRKRFRSAYIEVNRKNGKTTGILLPLVLYNFLKYKASESYIVSSRDDLSEKTFKEVRSVIKADKELDDKLKCQSLAITFKDEGENSRLSFFCDGGKSADGFKPRFFCLDEYHEYASDKMLDSMMMGLRSKKDAQGVIITTADMDVSRPCYQQNLKSKKILAGSLRQDDFFCIIYCLDEGDNYHDKKLWKKANPSLYEIIDESVLESDIANAELTPHKIAEMKAKTFGIWGGGGEKGWLPIEVWQKNKDISVDWSEFEGCECYGGLDLSMVDDLTVWTLMFVKDGKFYFKHRFYCPSETVYSKYQKDNVAFLDWVDEGIITQTDGATIDYNYIINDILEDAQRYKVVAIGYDKWQSRNIINEIDEKRGDIMLVEIDQSLKKLSPLTKIYEKDIRDGKVVDNSPVMTWMVNNVVIKIDANDNYKPLKRSKASSDKIDGVISSIMAMGVYHSEEVDGGKVTPCDWDKVCAMMF